MKKTFIIILFLTSMCLWAQNVPQTIDYQGRLADNNGNYLNEIVTVDFLIYDAEVDGTLLWNESQDVSTANGIFHVLLGSSVTFPTSLFDGADRWLELIVGNEILSPRTAIASVPYAIKAETAESIVGGITEIDPVYSDSEAANINATDITNLSNLSGTNTGDQNISGIADNEQAIQDTAAQIRADIPDVSGFITSETDPVYGSSVANGITSADTINWNNHTIDTKLDSTDISNMGFSLKPQMALYSVANETHIENSDAGYVLLYNISSFTPNSEIFELVTSNEYGIKIKKSGFLLVNVSQTLRATGGSTILQVKKNGNAIGQCVETSNGGFCGLNISLPVKVSANDIITFYIWGSGDNILDFYDNYWSNYSITWINE
ncbi:MAG: hypothetical protein U9P73_11285 [Candidatus Cloacimonadota bacterium]|nr:hypothetical protein [Candidatus Cloacimonadota bacterium]